VPTGRSYLEGPFRLGLSFYVGKVRFGFYFRIAYVTAFYGI
jgi:hypothetical protein